MAELTPADLVRARVEHALTAAQVNLASTAGRAQAEALIEEALRGYQAEALAGDGNASPQLRAQLRRELRDDLLGLGQVAERMLADPDATDASLIDQRPVVGCVGTLCKRKTVLS